MSSTTSMPLPTPRRFAIPSLLGLLACVAVLAGWFLPWTTLGEEVRRALDIETEDPAEVEVAGRRAGWDEGRLRALRRLHAGEAVNGPDWAALIGYAITQHRREDGASVEVRAWTAVEVVLTGLPWLAGILALGILLARLRPLPLPVLVGLQALGAVILGLAALLVLGSSVSSREAVARHPGALGVGLHAFVLGGLLAAIAGLVGVRRTNWWQAYLLGAIVVVGGVVGVFLWVRG